MEMIMLGIFIVITIIYGAFSIWNTFLAKKQIKMSMIDVIYYMILGAYAGTMVNIYAVLIIGILILLWLMVMVRQWDKNLIENNKKIMKENEEAN